MQERRSKLVSIHDAIAQIPDGAKVAIGGSLIRRAPMALVREIVRQKKKDLTLYSWSAGMDFDMLIGGGCSRRRGLLTSVCSSLALPETSAALWSKTASVL